MNKYYIIGLVGILLIGYSVSFYCFQNQYLNSNYTTIIPILDTIEKVPLVDTKAINDLVTFNTALQTESQTKSEKLLIEVSNSENDKLSSYAHYNLANYYIATQQYQRALAEFKLSIERYNNQDAKYNYELLMRLLKQQGKGKGEPQDGEQEGEGEKIIKIPGMGDGDGGIGW